MSPLRPPDTVGSSSQVVQGRGLLYGSEYVDGAREIAMSDSPAAWFIIEHPSQGQNTLESATWTWNFDLTVAVGTIDASVEERSLPPGGRYPFFRRAELDWSYQGSVVTLQNGNYDLSNTSVTSHAASLTKVQNGDLVFDTDIRRYAANGDQ
jgi:hypothetical protein